MVKEYRKISIGSVADNIPLKPPMDIHHPICSTPQRAQSTPHRRSYIIRRRYHRQASAITTALWQRHFLLRQADNLRCDHRESYRALAHLQQQTHPLMVMMRAAAIAPIIPHLHRIRTMVRTAPPMPVLAVQ